MELLYKLRPHLSTYGRAMLAMAFQHTAQPQHAKEILAEILARRERLKLSAEAYGRLMGVSGLTIYQWEYGRSRPRKGMLAKLVAARDIGRREALHRLEMLDSAKKPKAAQARKVSRAKR